MGEGAEMARFAVLALSCLSVLACAAATSETAAQEPQVVSLDKGQKDEVEAYVAKSQAGSGEHFNALVKRVRSQIAKGNTGVLKNLIRQRIQSAKSGKESSQPKKTKKTKKKMTKKSATEKEKGSVQLLKAKKRASETAAKVAKLSAQETNERDKVDGLGRELESLKLQAAEAE